MRKSRFKQKSNRLGWLGGLLLVLIIGAPVQAQKATIFDLDQAICSNRWDRAIDLTGRLIADEQTSNAQRLSLIAMRRQLEQYRLEDTILAASEVCDRVNSYQLTVASMPSSPAGSPLRWEAAVAEATDNQYSSVPLTAADRLAIPVNVSDRSGLMPAESVNLARGLSVVSGNVGQGHQVYSFVAGRGDRVSINLEVTRVLTGSLYTSDDSQLFVFDAEGRLLDSIDDSHGGQQSRIDDLIIPRTSVYFAVVTTYNNDPIFTQDGKISGWQDNGGGRFDYTLSFAGATPTNALLNKMPEAID